MLMALLATLPGVACIYQGEELGLTEVTISAAEMRDPYGINFYPAFAGRDGCRTPMPWHAGARHGGFTAASQPWLPVPDEHLPKAVDRQAADNGSLLNDHRRFLQWRKWDPALLRGKARLLPVPEPLFAIERVSTGRRLLAVFNLGSSPISLERSLLPACRALDAPGFQVEVTSDSLFFPPYAAFFAVVNS